MRQRKVPQRTCVGCRETMAKQSLIRIVRTPEGEVLIDPTGKKSGRGAYVCPSKDCIDQAVKGERLARALNYKLTPDVLNSLNAQLVELR